jgi:HEAT repeat protein
MVGLLAHALEDSVESVRQAAVVVFGDIEPGSRLLQVDSSHSVPALVAAGRDSDAEDRQGIVAAVGEWGGAAVFP